MDQSTSNPQFTPRVAGEVAGLLYLGPGEHFTIFGERPKCNQRRAERTPYRGRNNQAYPVRVLLRLRKP